MYSPKRIKLVEGSKTDFRLRIVDEEREGYELV